jgi:predicted PurR-regulated permease PerM
MATSPEKVYVGISFGTILKAVGLVLFLIVLYLLRDLVLVVLVSVVIASAIEPVTKRLARYRIPRVPAVLLMYILFFGLILVLVPLFVFPILGDLSDLSTTVADKIGSIPTLLSNSALGSWTGSLGNSFSVHDVFLSLQSSFGSVPKGFVQTTSLVFGGFFRFILIIVISFYLSVQQNGIENFLRVVTPIDREKYVLSLWKRSQQKIGYWMQGQLLLGLIIGILVFLGLTILNVKYALVLAILAALFELIPFFGPILSAVPAVLLGFSDSVTLGLMTIGLYIIMQQFENHLIYPLVVKKIVGVPPLLVILSLLVGAQLAGFLGLVLAVPLAAVLMEAMGDFEKSKYLFRKIDVE